ncbi:MAG TPA: BrnT family toxin [Armatimonadota bacterium]
MFDDPLAAIREDVHHSADETREHVIGLSTHRRLLQVTFTERGNLLKIISARVATRRDRTKYEQR